MIMIAVDVTIVWLVFMLVRTLPGALPWEGGNILGSFGRPWSAVSSSPLMLLLVRSLNSSSLICTHLHSSSLIFTHLHSSALIFTHLHSSSLIFTHLHSSSLILLDLTSHNLIFYIRVKQLNLSSLKLQDFYIWIIELRLRTLHKLNRTTCQGYNMTLLYFTFLYLNCQAFLQLYLSSFHFIIIIIIIIIIIVIIIITIKT